VIHTPQDDRNGLDVAFTEEEIKTAVNGTPSGKASDPGDFTGAFFKDCWSIVKYDIMAMVNQFSTLFCFFLTP
jgi:hypothetical protein